MKPLIFFVSVAFLIMIGLTGAYFSGLWIPNNPSPSIYPIRGIDVSGHQGKVDWKLVAEHGINFVYMKATEAGDFETPSLTATCMVLVRLAWPAASIIFSV